MRRFSAVASAPAFSRRADIVPMLSSAARMPFPGATIRAAVCRHELMGRSFPRRSTVPNLRVAAERGLTHLVERPGDAAQLSNNLSIRGRLSIDMLTPAAPLFAAWQ